MPFKPAFALSSGNDTDRMALFSLKEQLASGSPGALTSWNDSVHFCDWEGVQCGRRHQRVRTLNLGSMKLAGFISPLIANLTFLRKVNFSDNLLKGNIPIEFGHLRRLRYLNLTHNNLHGQLPVELTNCSNLQVLYLSYNNLTGNIPFNLGGMNNLIQFSLRQNNLSGAIPSSLGNLSSLIYLVLAENHFQGNIPSALGRLSKLKYLTLLNNKLSGTLPPAVYNLSSIVILSFSGNQLYGDLDFISSLTNCTQLQYLLLHMNSFGGVLPGSVAKLSTQLQLLNVGGNQIFGSIPEAIGNLFNLNSLFMALNLLTGGIPNSIGKLQNLKGLALEVNSLFGKIPSSIGNLTKLSALYLSENNFEGRIPLSLRNCKSLERLDLSSNKLIGDIPDQLLSATKNLFLLNLSHNSFIGFLPSDIGNLKNLVALYVDHNNFYGEIPKELGDSSQLTIIFIQRNSLEGSIPKSLGYLRALQTLDLSHNNLSGVIPLKLAKLPLLMSLILSFNQLEGEVPKDGVFKNVSGFYLSQNKKLCGGIPEIELPKCFRKELIPVSLSKDGGLGLSYKDLLEATQGFSSSNLIGSGSFGSVYKGALHQQQKPIAVKVLNLQNHGAARSFKGNDFKALVFEFMPNGSLESWLHEQNESRYLNLATRLDIAVDVANAIDYLHHDCEVSIVHCDLKPTNVLLDDDLVAHVADFGLAKLMSSEIAGNISSDQTSSSMLKGTIGYITPEYGMGATISQEGDIYSYGILILEMITGRRPIDDLFYGGLSLHNYCKMALPDRLMEILDFRLLEEIDENKHRLRTRPNMEGEIWECLPSFTKIGVACSVEAPDERMRIKDAIVELHATKGRLLRTRVHTGDRR
ncbi:hypothetical protein PTKIN_Ptkin16aG0537700 [Pterospermum kingtungense]